MPVFAAPEPPIHDLVPQPEGVAWPTHEWPTAAAPAPLVELADTAFSAGDDGPWGMSLAFVVVQGGRLVLERYGPTASASERLISWSMAKSMAHALVGVAVRDGLIDIAGRAPIAEWADPDDPRHRITLDQLLRMSGGTLFVEDYVDDEVSHCIDMLFGAGNDDMAAYTAALPAVAEPDEVFNYSSGTTNLVCRILADLVGAGPDFESWMRRELLDPIGMASSTLTFDGAGTWVGSSFLHATARDFAKFGLLYLRDGVWDGTRLLPEGWADYARTPRAVDDEGSVYGAHWWIWDPAAGVFACQGYETQRILVDPGADAVVVRLGKTPIEKAPHVDAWLREVLATLR
ncbi:MAG: serine hydrolase [Actinomycetota bacterium]